MSLSPAEEPSLRISVDDRPDEIRSLADWLRREDQLRGRVSFRPAARPADGEMGGVVDVLSVAFGAGGAGAVLAGTLSTWLASRRADLKVTVTARDGAKVELDAHRVRDVAEVLRELQRLAHGPDQPE
ncbi:effector-associated constant component EACC1 [Amycolatopsis sp. NPDC003865]